MSSKEFFVLDERFEINRTVWNEQDGLEYIGRFGMNKMAWNE